MVSLLTVDIGYKQCDFQLPSDSSALSDLSADTFRIEFKLVNHGYRNPGLLRISISNDLGAKPTPEGAQLYPFHRPIFASDYTRSNWI